MQSQPNCVTVSFRAARVPSPSREPPLDDKGLPVIQGMSQEELIEGFRLLYGSQSQARGPSRRCRLAAPWFLPMLPMLPPLLCCPAA